MRLVAFLCIADSSRMLQKFLSQKVSGLENSRLYIPVIKFPVFNIRKRQYNVISAFMLFCQWD